MNQRNVEALERIITAIRDAAAGAGGEDYVYLSDRQLAEALAREGWFHPSVLTDKQCENLGAGGCDAEEIGWKPEYAVEFRQQLEQIAKGNT